MVVTQALVVDEMDAMKGERLGRFRLEPCFCLPNHVNVPSERDVERSHNCTVAMSIHAMHVDVSNLPLSH
jgi:hypothetical protein